MTGCVESLNLLNFPREMGDLLLECDVYLPISMSVVFHYILIFTGCYWIVMSIASLFLDEDFLFEKIIVAEIVTILVC